MRTRIGGLATWPRTSSGTTRWRLWTSAGALIALTFLLRLPFFDAPLTADEGGYAEVARLWSRGATLYRGDWVDRPQGLIATFRGLLSVGLTSTVDLRVAAAAIAVLLGLLVVVVAGSLVDVRTGLIAGLLATVAGGSPFIEGFTLAGELVATVAATGAVAVFIEFARGGNRIFLVLAGVLGGSAVMIKQSAFDGILAALVALIIARRRRALPEVAILIGAAAIPVAVCVAASGDSGAWYRAVVAYGVHAAQPPHERWHLFKASLPAFERALGPLVLLAAIGWRRSPPIARIWIVTAVLGVSVGGNFNAHYYLQLVAPLALTGAIGVSGPERWRQLAAGAAVLSTIAVAAPLWFVSDATQAQHVWPVDRHLLSDAAVVRYVRGHTTRSEPIYVLWAAADIYYLADRPPALRYLWIRNLQTIHGAVAEADRMLARRVPVLVVEVEPIGAVDSSARTRAILEQEYRVVARVGRDLILRRRAA